MDAYPALPALKALAITLQARHGIELPHRAELDNITSWLNDARTMEPEHIDLTTATRETIREHVLTVAVARTARPQINDVVDSLAKQAYSELVDKIAARADEVLDALRPKFDQAAEKARELIAMGVPAHATAETFLDLPVKPREAWKEFKTVHTPVLESVLNARISLSGALRLPPLGMSGPYDTLNAEEVDWGITVTNPHRHLGKPVSGREHERWLAAAEVLHLNGIHEVDQLDYRAAAGDQYANQARAVAHARAATKV